MITRLTRGLAAVGAVFAGWLLLSAALAFAAPPGRSIAVIGPSGAKVVASAGGTLLRAGDTVTIARSDEANFVARLYAAGALLVVDADNAGGCSGKPQRIAAVGP